MNTSCREGSAGALTNGYWRGVRDFFPEGTFEPTRLQPVASEGTGVCHGSCAVNVERLLNHTMPDSPTRWMTPYQRENYRQELYWQFCARSRETVRRFLERSPE